MENPGNAVQVVESTRLSREEALKRLAEAKTTEAVLAVVRNYGGLPVGPAPGWEKYIPLPSLFGAGR